VEDKDFKVGDLVRLKKAFGTRYAHPFKTPVFSDSIKTRICRVYWLRLERTNWEYEDDLSFADDEETDSPIITK